MPVPVAITVAYLAVNLAMIVSIERTHAAGRAPWPSLVTLSRALRYGPPLIGAVYLVAMTGDWLFVGFVLGFFAGALWLMTGLAAYTDLSVGAEAMRSGWDDRKPVRRTEADGDRS